MRIIRRSSFTAVPWKNGGGITHEALRVPAGGGPFRWRVSVAHIESSGPFSDFAGYRRFMTLLSGAGLRLTFSGGPPGHPAESELREVGDLVAFDGAAAAHCDLLNGPCVDLNLMVAECVRSVQVRIEALHAALALAPAPEEAILLVPLEASVELCAGSSDPATTIVLEPWDLALLDGGQRDRVSLAQRFAEHGRPAAPAGAPAAARVFLATLADS